MNKDVDYSAYIASEAWRLKRLEVLERDRHQCQTCLSAEDLEVHHKTYERLGNEDLYDLITLCHGCHEAITNVIRQRRYSNRTIEVFDSIPNIYTRTTIEVTHGRTTIEISDNGGMSSNRSFRTDGRSDESLCKGSEADQFKALQNRRGF